MKKTNILLVISSITVLGSCYAMDEGLASKAIGGGDEKVTAFILAILRESRPKRWCRNFSRGLVCDPYFKEEVVEGYPCKRCEYQVEMFGKKDVSDVDVDRARTSLDSGKGGQGQYVLTHVWVKGDRAIRRVTERVGADPFKSRWSVSDKYTSCYACSSTDYAGVPTMMVTCGSIYEALIRRMKPDR